MPEYRIYKLNGQGHATGPALVLICGRDADVIQKVESLVDGQDVEIMDGARIVARLKSGPLARGGGCPTAVRASGPNSRAQGPSAHASSHLRLRPGQRVRAIQGWRSAVRALAPNRYKHFWR
jgi:hypothetical protein